MRYLKAGSILRVNLSTGEITKTPTAPYDDQFVGGRGVQVKILYDEAGPGVGPLSPDNLLMFGTGPFTGTLVPGSARTEITAKSPITGALGMSNFGGYFAAELKYAGCDHLVVKGKARGPVCLWIDDDKVEIRDAGHLRGKDCYETPSIIRKELGEPNAQVASIGRAGENLVRYATIQTKIGDGAGRTGMGCVMGSKNLKAVAVRGTRGVRVADPEAFYAATERAHNLLAEAGYVTKSESFSLGNSFAAGTDYWGKEGLLPRRNHRIIESQRAYDHPMEPYYYEKRPRRFGCFACPVRCMDSYNVSGRGAGVSSCVLYTEVTYGTDLWEHDDWFDALLVCQKNGVDVVSLGAMIGWAMELYERGIITDEDTGGVRLAWGDREAIFAIIEQVISRQGFGDILAGSPAEAVARLGKKGAGQYLMQVKGNPLPSQNVVNFRHWGLSTAVGNRGDMVRSLTHSDLILQKSRVLAHEGKDPDPIGKLAKARAKVKKLTGNPDDIETLSYEGKARLVHYAENCTAVADMVLECKWHTPWVLTQPIDPAEQASMLSTGSGELWTEERLIEAAERLIALERAYNAREGFARKDDTLPDRMFSSTPLPGRFGDDVLERDKFEKMKDEYYALRGWDITTGIPTKETLERLGLGDVAKDLANALLKVVPVG